jgi:hypothetical protein
MRNIIASSVSVMDISRMIAFNAKHVRSTIISKKNVEHVPIATILLQV